jgi:hypothetical protein
MVVAMIHEKIEAELRVVHVRIQVTSSQPLKFFIELYVPQSLLRCSGKGSSKGTEIGAWSAIELKHFSDPGGRIGLLNCQQKYDKLVSTR